MSKDKEISKNYRQIWNKPEIYKLRVNETFSGNKGNGEIGKPTHKPKASV